MPQRTKIQDRAVESLFDVFEGMCEGAISVDHHARIVWINEKYRSLLNVGDSDEVLGQDIENIIPESLMRQVIRTGKPIPIDIMRFGDRHFVVSRLPLRDSAGRIAGAVGFVLYDSLDYLKPLISKFERLHSRLSTAEAELAVAHRTRYSIANIVGASPQMVEIRRQARRLAQMAGSVLLLGETGTGKELLAQSIHTASDRAQRPFVAVNMSAIPETLLEAEFFGVAPGAYTGADRRGRKGKFEIASGGTLFLDEIGDMPVHLQAKLLRALEEQASEPIGSNEVRHVDVRIIAATSQDLEAKVKTGEFRKDLFYRLNVLPIHIPPLRERLFDVRPLAEVLLEQIAAVNGMPVREIDNAALLLLQRHAWPGNVRELRNVLERACLANDDSVLGAEVVAPLLPNLSAPQDSPAGNAQAGPSLPDLIANVERESIMGALRTTGGKKAAAARMLGIARSTLYEKIEEHGLSDFQS